MILYLCETHEVQSSSILGSRHLALKLRMVKCLGLKWINAENSETVGDVTVLLMLVDREAS